MKLHGARRIVPEMRAAQRLIESGAAPQLSNLVPVGDGMMTWRFHVSNFDPDMASGRALNADLRALAAKHGQGFILMECTFPENYPTEPLFLRIVSPRCMWYTGHVTAGGSICIESLVNTGTPAGWQPEYGFASMVTLVLANMLDCEEMDVRTATGPGGKSGPLRIDLQGQYHGGPGSVIREYAQTEAKGAYQRMVANHGWQGGQRGGGGAAAAAAAAAAAPQGAAAAAAAHVAAVAGLAAARAARTAPAAPAPAPLPALPAAAPAPIPTGQLRSQAGVAWVVHGAGGAAPPAAPAPGTLAAAGAGRRPGHPPAPRGAAWVSGLTAPGGAAAAGAAAAPAAATGPVSTTNAAAAVGVSRTMASDFRVVHKANVAAAAGGSHPVPVSLTTSIDDAGGDGGASGGRQRKRPAPAAVSMPLVSLDGDSDGPRKKRAQAAAAAAAAPAPAAAAAAGPSTSWVPMFVDSQGDVAIMGTQRSPAQVGRANRAPRGAVITIDDYGDDSDDDDYFDFRVVANGSGGGGCGGRLTAAALALSKAVKAGSAAVPSSVRTRQQKQTAAVAASQDDDIQIVIAPATAAAAAAAAGPSSSSRRDDHRANAVAAMRSAAAVAAALAADAAAAGLSSAHARQPQQQAAAASQDDDIQVVGWTSPGGGPLHGPGVTAAAAPGSSPGAALRARRTGGGGSGGGGASGGGGGGTSVAERAAAEEQAKEHAALKARVEELMAQVARADEERKKEEAARAAAIAAGGDDLLADVHMRTMPPSWEPFPAAVASTESMLFVLPLLWEAQGQHAPGGNGQGEEDQAVEDLVASGVRREDAVAALEWATYDMAIAVEFISRKFTSRKGGAAYVLKNHPNPPGGPSDARRQEYAQEKAQRKKAEEDAAVQRRGADAEAEVVASKWETNTGLDRTRIARIERVQNRQLWSTFFLKRKVMVEHKRSNGLPATDESVQMLVWHGSRREDLGLIVNKGFDFRIANKGGALGVGTYFAEDPRYSMQYCNNTAPPRGVGVATAGAAAAAYATHGSHGYTAAAAAAAAAAAGPGAVPMWPPSLGSMMAAMPKSLGAAYHAMAGGGAPPPAPFGANPAYAPAALAPPKHKGKGGRHAAPPPGGYVAAAATAKQVAPPLADGTKIVLLCRVLIGASAVGAPQMVRPPDSYDSVYGGGYAPNPTEQGPAWPQCKNYCVFDNAMCYPEYVVHFKPKPAAAAARR
ncbi:hypothetical protein FOA52_001146 [Chlamydomonas sp. UWO 241]|nr:hypothetical protein FOA52_001146 [Chlamydomonas sp. UWO 241]